jgi:hypothetical protein
LPLIENHNTPLLLKRNNEECFFFSRFLTKSECVYHRVLMKIWTDHQQNWETLVSMFPPDWETLSRTCGAFRRCREFQTPEALLRTFLLHVANGYSLRETVTIAREAGLASVSDTALSARFQRAESWLQTLCQQLFHETGIALPAAPPALQMRLVDGTTVKEPGPQGGQWCLHFSVQVPVLRYDFATITPTKGPGTGESLTHFPIAPHECMIGDRAYSKAPGIAHAATQGGVVIIRLNTWSLPLFHRTGQAFDLLSAVSPLQTPGIPTEWPIALHLPDDVVLDARLCALRKDEQAIALAHQRLRRSASRGGRTIKPTTFEFAKFILIITTVPWTSLSTPQILEWYRVRWQIELVFKRLKSLAKLGALPMRNDASARAWLYGKLFVALLVEKLLRHARSFFSCAAHAGHAKTPQRVA